MFEMDDSLFFARRKPGTPGTLMLFRKAAAGNPFAKRGSVVQVV